ncbi:unnamed protein product [Rangifer tarandus platyrhynchus]|uniref:Uncharacterized protein n=1 Tax=Rangifer tarandus platyrhynchus TaxID=3082113 RepID=A0ABN9A3X8_RANTA|nr:unnamed protein product [Rangifer tarandus platyrhynchus]
MAGIGQDVRLLVEEDSTAEVEVVTDVEQEQLSSQEPEENPEQEPARPGTPIDLPDHTGGAGVTGGPSGSEFNSGNVKDHRAYIRIRWSNHQSEGYLAQRCAIFQGITCFWAQAPS